MSRKKLLVSPRVSKINRRSAKNITPGILIHITIASSPAQLKALDALKFDLQVKAELNEPEVQKNFKLGNSKSQTTKMILIALC